MMKSIIFRSVKHAIELQLGAPTAENLGLNYGDIASAVSAALEKVYTIAPKSASA